MTNITRRLATIAGVLVMATALGCASTAKTEGTGEYVDDTVVTSKVKAAIFNEPSLKSAEINVETFKGVVQLSGFRELGGRGEHGCCRGAQGRRRQVGQERHAFEVTCDLCRMRGSFTRPAHPERSPFEDGGLVRGRTCHA